NSGLITAGSAGTVNIGGTWDDNSLVTGSAPGRVNLYDTGTWSAAALNADAGAGVGLYGTLTHSSPLLLTGSGRVGLSRGALEGTAVTLDAGNALFVDDSAHLDGVTLNGILDATAGGHVYVTDGLTLNGTALLGAADGSRWAQMHFQGTQTLGGMGDIL